MAEIDKVNVTNLSGIVNSTLVQTVIADAKKEFSRVVWNYYNLHKNDVILSKKVWFFTINLRLDQIRFVFE